MINFPVVTASERGIVIGDISFKDGEEVVHHGNECGKKGVSVPYMTEDVKILAAGSQVLFILIVKKHNVWNRLAEESFTRIIDVS